MKDLLDIDPHTLPRDDFDPPKARLSFREYELWVQEMNAAHPDRFAPLHDGEPFILEAE